MVLVAVATCGINIALWVVFLVATRKMVRSAIAKLALATDELTETAEQLADRDPASPPVIDPGDRSGFFAPRPHRGFGPPPTP